MLRAQRRVSAAASLIASALAASTSLVTPGTALAQTLELPTIQVTANRVPQPIARAGSAITVITAEEIAQASARDVGDLLRRVPGVTLTQSGGPGQLQVARIRGGDVRHTLVMIDGIRVNDPSSTGREFDFSTLVLANVERIEVLRGPQSALYGSDAMGGVINIITKRGEGPPRGSVAVEAGSYGTKEIRAGVSGSTDRVSYAFGFSGLDTAGFSTYGYRIPRITSRFPYRFEADGSERAGGSARIGVQVTDTTRVEFGGGSSVNVADYDAAFGAFPDTPSVARSFLTDGYARVLNDSFGGVLHSDLKIYANRVERRFRDISYGAFGGPLLTFANRNEFIGERAGVEYQGDVKLGAFGTFTFGAKAERERADGFSRDLTVPAFGPDRDFAAEQTTRSLFALHQFSIGERWHLSVGGRIDDVEGPTRGGVGGDAGDTFVTWRATSAYEILESGTKLRASAGTGGKAPSLYQLFSFYGNRNLESERSVGVDAGIDQALFDGRLTLSGTVFFNRYRELIDFAFDPAICTPSQIFGCYINVARAETSGFELSADAEIVPNVARLKVAYTYLRAVDLTTDLTLARRPENEARIALTLTPLPRLTIEPRLTLVGERFSSPGESLKLAPYARVDVYADYKITDTLSVYARAENLTDARYEEVSGYGTPGRSFYGGLRATW